MSDSCSIVRLLVLGANAILHVELLSDPYRYMHALTEASFTETCSRGLPPCAIDRIDSFLYIWGESLVPPKGPNPNSTK